MFKDFEFFSHTYQADFSHLTPIIKIRNKMEILPLVKQFEQSQTFFKYKSVTFLVNDEKVKVDLTHRF